MTGPVQRTWIAIGVCLVALDAAPAGSPATAATDAAQVYGVDAAHKPIDLVYGVHGFLMVRGTIDESHPGAQGPTILIHPLDNTSGRAACPVPAPQATEPFDNVLAVGSPFDLAYISGAWNIAARVRFCFYFVHPDGSQTQSSQDVTFRQPIDKVTLTAPNLPAAKRGVSRMLPLTLGGESDHQYGGFIRVHAASKACKATYTADTGVAGDIPNPGGVRYWSRYYASSKSKGPRVHLGAIGKGTYRVCAWIGPPRQPVSTSTTTLTIE